MNHIILLVREMNCTIYIREHKYPLFSGVFVVHKTDRNNFTYEFHIIDTHSTDRNNSIYNFHVINIIMSILDTDVLDLVTPRL